MSERLDLPVTEWRRVSSKYVIVDVIGYVIFALMVLIPAGLVSYWIGFEWMWAATISLTIIFLLTIVFTPRRVRSIGYALRDDDLLFRRGILFQRFVSIPYGRMQLVDINRGPVARALGLSELKFVTAAAASGVTIPGLPEADAEELRDTLVALAETRRGGL